MDRAGCEIAKELLGAVRPRDADVGDDRNLTEAEMDARIVAGAITLGGPTFLNMRFSVDMDSDFGA